MKTRRDFLKTLTALVAAPAALACRSDNPPVIEDPGQFGTPWYAHEDYLQAARLLRAQESALMEKIYRDTHPPILVNEAQIDASDLEIEPGTIHLVPEQRFEWQYEGARGFKLVEDEPMTATEINRRHEWQMEKTKKFSSPFGVITIKEPSLPS